MVFSLVRNTAAPAKVKQASLLMLSYAAAILIGTVLFAVKTDFTHSKELIRGLVRVAGISYLAFWLLKLDKRAWWFAVVACAVFASFGVVGILTLGFVGIAHDASVFSLLLGVILPTYFLGHATLILVQRETRELFQGHKDH